MRARSAPIAISFVMRRPNLSADFARRADRRAGAAAVCTARQRHERVRSASGLAGDGVEERRRAKRTPVRLRIAVAPDGVEVVGGRVALVPIEAVAGIA